MNTNTGEILNADAVEAIRRSLNGVLPDHIKHVRIHLTPRQLRRGKVGRNEPCPCGSGKKFKRCCYTGRVTASSLMQRRKRQG